MNAETAIRAPYRETPPEPSERAMIRESLRLEHYAEFVRTAKRHVAEELSSEKPSIKQLLVDLENDCEMFDMHELKNQAGRIIDLVDEADNKN